jgi:hypothetical protein
MKLMMAFGAMVFAGGCAGVTADLAWPDPMMPPTETAATDPAIGMFGSDTRLPQKSFFGNSFRFKSEDESMKFENVPLRTLRYDNAMLPLDKKVDAPLPGSLMEPWRAFGSVIQPSSVLLWSRGVPGVTENGFFGSIRN